MPTPELLLQGVPLSHRTLGCHTLVHVFTTTSIALSTRTNAFSVCGISNPHDTSATDGYGAINRLSPPGSPSLTLLDLGFNLFVCIVA